MEPGSGHLALGLPGSRTGRKEFLQSQHPLPPNLRCPLLGQSGNLLPRSPSSPERSDNRDTVGLCTPTFTAAGRWKAPKCPPAGSRSGNQAREPARWSRGRPSRAMEV